MTIGTPVSIGSVTSATANVSSIALTTTGAISAGALVVVVVQIPSNAGSSRTVSSVSDGTNSYTFAVSTSAATADVHEIWYKENASAVASGATLTATLSGTTVGGNGYGLEAFTVAGIVASGALDKTNSSSATTSTPSVATGTLSQALEVVIGASWTGGATPTYTEASGFTNLFNLVPGAATRAGVGYQIVASTSTVTYAPTFSASSINMTLVASF